MGSVYQANCPCGFQQSVTVGGSKSNFETDARFPFYCRKCGLVDVNICETRLRCPQCHSRAIKVYGKPPISPPQSSDRELSWEGYSAGRAGHLCPACKRHHLYFDLHIMFD
jgi:hypothetical protein